MPPDQEPRVDGQLLMLPSELGSEPKIPKAVLNGSPKEAPPYIADYFLEKRDSSLTGYQISLLGHGVLLVLGILKMALFPDHTLTYIPSLRVDMVGLPEILKKDLQDVGKPSAAAKQIEEALKKADQEIAKEKAKAKEKSEPLKKDEMAIKHDQAKEREKKLKNALARIKALNKVTAADDAAEAEAIAEAKKAAVIKGNMISKGTSLSAEARESMQMDYLESFRSKLHENWMLPTLLQRQELSAQVRIFIDKYGKLVRYVFTKPSGNPRFDEEVKNAIESAQPYPAPPDHYADALRFQGAEFGFPL